MRLTLAALVLSPLALVQAQLPTVTPEATLEALPPPTASIALSLPPASAAGAALPAPTSLGAPLAAAPPTLCDPKRSVLDQLSHRFRSDCGQSMWCDASAAVVGAVPAPLNNLAAQEPDIVPDESSDLAGNIKMTGLRTDPDVSEGSSSEEDESSEGGEGGGENYEFERRGLQATNRVTVLEVPPLLLARNLSRHGHAARGSANAVLYPRDILAPRGSRVSLPPSSSTPAAVPGAAPTMGTCKPKGCRRDEYPFGYKGVAQADLPPLCGEGQYCPDEESVCMPLIPIGGTCELNRDDSCAQAALASAPLTARQLGAPNMTQNTGPTMMDLPGPGMGGGSFESHSLPSPPKALCLQGSCTLASAAAGQVCIVDHTQYLGYDVHGKEVGEVVVRDNCMSALYCDDDTHVCMPEKEFGATCGADRECLEFNCNPERKCDLPPEAPNRVPGWAFGLIGVAIFVLLLATVACLYRIHTAHRVARADQIDRYFSEQWTYRQSILSMHAAYVSAGGAPESLGSEYADTPKVASSSTSSAVQREHDSSQQQQQQRRLFASEAGSEAGDGWSSSATGNEQPRLARRKPAPSY